jgi:catechol 2,3-dioxygenase
MIPHLAFSHVGLWVSDLGRMERFYAGVLGFTVTDRGKLGDTDLVFLSRDPTEHHQVVLAAGRPRAASFSTVNQISLRTPDLAALRGWYHRVRAAGVDELQPVTHGNAVSIYFRDPEGNRIEIFIDTPWYTTQPMRVPVDLDRPDDEIWRQVEELCLRSPGHKSRADWEAEMRARMNR